MALLKDIAEIRLLADTTTPIKPRIIIFHTMVGSLKGTENHFKSPSVNVESHFGVGGATDGDLDGVIFQWVDTEMKAHANNQANAFAISIETSDGGDPRRPWSPKQVEALIRLTRRLGEVHSIPMRVVTSAHDRQGGLGFHVQFGAPGPWTPVAKSCPGEVRIAQLLNEVYPALGIGSPSTSPASNGSVPAFPGSILTRGSKGSAVCQVQSRLRELGHPIDSIKGCPFGPQTQSAVRKFQLANGIADNGQVDELTWKTLFNS